MKTGPLSHHLTISKIPTATSHFARTLTPSIFVFFEEFTTQWNYAFAASILAIIPIVVAFLILQKQFIKGLVAGSIK